MQHSVEFIELCEAAKKNIHEISTLEVSAKLKGPLNFCLIDVRELAEYKEGHLPQATHLSRGTIEIHIHKLVNKNQEIILYCGGGNRSALAAEILQKMGYHNVWSMAGGFKNWLQDQLPVSYSR